MDPQPAIVASGSTGTLLLSGRTLASLRDWHLSVVSAARGWNLSAILQTHNEYWLRQAQEDLCTLELDVGNKLWVFKDARIDVEGPSLYARGFNKPDMR